MSLHTAVPLPSSSGDPTFGNDKRAILLEKGFTKGMIHQLELAMADCPLHVWILDNSASTNQADCYRMMSTKDLNDKRLVKCTRWEDIMDSAMYQAQLATWIHAPISFRLLNTCPDIASEFTIASQPYMSDEEAAKKEDLKRFQQWLKKVQPTGRTPLTHHIYEFQQLIRSMEQSLRSKAQHVVLTILTDGLPSNERGICNDEQNELFRKSLKTLEKLPIQVIIRLNTDHGGIKKFYSELKYDVKFRIVTMNAFLSEAQSIHQFNDWLTYSLSIHHMREFGAVPSCVDLISERELLLYEMRDCIMFLFGYEMMAGINDPTSAGWSSFIATSKRSLKAQKEQWDPLRNKLQPMLNIRRLSQVYGPSGACNII